jgi:hypothetical protein
MRGINPAMPWPTARPMTDNEIKAVLKYLRTVPEFRPLISRQQTDQASASST